MDEKEFKKLIKKDKYQVFLFSCPANIPFNFARHHWFVVNSKGKINRWDVLRTYNLLRTDEGTDTKESFGGKKFKIISKKVGYVYKNILPFTSGVSKYRWKLKPFSKGELVSSIEGNSNSIAHKMIAFIEHNSFKYKHRNKYYILGPNSNTFIQWIIDKFPGCGFKLSWRAVGKNYKVKD